jgi:hypothetical protein
VDMNRTAEDFNVLNCFKGNFNIYLQCMLWLFVYGLYYNITIPDTMKRCSLNLAHFKITVF